MSPNELVYSHGKTLHPKKSTQIKKFIWASFLNNFRGALKLCNREEGKSSRELFGKVRVNAVLFFWYFGILGGLGSEGRGCLEKGCLGLLGVFPDIS